MSDAIPTTREELNRKAVDVLVQNNDKLELGQISKAVAYATAKTVWNVTAGLVDEDVASLAGQQADAIGPQPLRRHFIGMGKVVRIGFNSHTDGYLVQSFDVATGKADVVKLSKAPVGERESEIAKLAGRLVDSGMVEF